MTWNDGSDGAPARGWRSRPAARFGPWLVLIWPPLLLGAHLFEAWQSGRWAVLLALLAVGAAFVVTIVAWHRPWSPAAARVTPAAGVLVQGLLTALTLSLVDVEQSGLAYLLLPLLVIAIGVVFPRGGPSLMVLVTLVVFVAGLVAGWAAGTTLWLCVITLLSGLGTYVVHRLADTVAELERTRRELADAAVAAERLRFSRDLHDLLGHTLSVIVVKAEAVRRFAADDPAAAAGHGADIESLGRSALREVREAVAGYRDGGLSDELSRAASALRAAGVRPEVEPVTVALDPLSQEVLGWVVREGVTNVLRHSDASTCRITVTAEQEHVCLRITDDGTTPSAGPAGEGAGLPGLRERVLAAGGRFRAGPAGQGFVVAAEVPR